MIHRRSRTATLATSLVATALLTVTCTPIPAPARSQGDPSTTVPLQRGDLLPEFTFVDADGDEVRSADLLGAVAVLTFAAPGAPFADALLDRLATVDRRLASSPPSTRFVVFALGSTAPSNAALGTGRPPDWLLLTRPSAQIVDFATRLGVMTWTEDDGPAHTLRVVVVGPSGRVTDLLEGLSSWSVEDLLASVTAAR